LAFHAFCTSCSWIYIGIQAFQTQSILSGLLAGFLLYQVVTNSGCGGTNGCAVPLKKRITTPLKMWKEEITTKE
jgi:hypothetical protein